MQLPGPLRAAVGLAATAADEVRHLPDRAIELPMLAVSTALQMSLRAQQRYARLAARGDEVLGGRRPPGDEPPPWATFDDPVTADAFRSAFGGGEGPDGTVSASDRRSLFEDLFGVEHPSAGTPGGAPDDDRPDADVIPLGVADASASPQDDDPAGDGASDAPRAARKSARKSARKAAPRTPSRASVPRTAAKKAARKRAVQSVTDTDEATAPADDAADGPTGKSVNKPRHTTPSKFDDVDDD